MWDNPYVMIPLVVAILGARVWLTFLIEKWAISRGRTGRAWFICAFLWMIPTVIVLALLPKKPVIRMQPSSKHQIDLAVPETVIENQP
jgi:hypothetical protein